MERTMKKTLQQKYEDVCNEYVKEFCKKQGFNYTDLSWIANQIGGVVEIDDLYFNFHDIVWDINSKQPKHQIIDWYYALIENPEKSMNYFSYTKGLRHKDL